MLVFAVLYGGSYIWFRRSGLNAGFKKVSEMDFVSGSYDEERDRDYTVDDTSPKTFRQKFLDMF